MKNKRLSVLLASALATLFLLWSTSAAAKDKEDKENDRIQNAANVLKEIIDVPDNIPQNLLDKARCLLVFPSVMKAAFVVGGSYGRGVMVCRGGSDFTGQWGAPAMMALEAGSVGFQIGGEAPALLILVLNNPGVGRLPPSTGKPGADASRSAGPQGPDGPPATQG